MKLIDKPLTPEDEAALVAAGNIAELVERTLKPALEWSPRAAQGRLDQSVLLSLTYDALVRAARTFKPERGRFLAFCKPFIRFAVIRHWNSEAASQALPASVETTEDFDGSTIRKETAYSEPDTRGIELRDMWSVLEPALKILNRQDRRIVELFYMEGISLAGIARRLGVTRQAVSARHRSALMVLKTHIKSRT